MKTPQFVVVTVEGKAACYQTQDTLIDGFMKKEFTEKDNVYSVKERLRLQPTALLIEQKKSDKKETETHD